MVRNKFINRLGRPALLASALVFPTAALAQVTSGNLNVQITIMEECTLGTISDINFGSTGLLASNIDATGSIEVTCTAGTDYTLALGTGEGAGATEAIRQMTGAGGTVAYSLYQDAGNSTLWGANTNAFSGVGTGSAVALDVFGSVPSQSTPAAGIYSDIVTVTLAY